MEKVVTAQMREAQIRILPAPDLLVGYTDQDCEDFLMNMRNPGRTRFADLSSRYFKGEREAWNKGGDTTPAFMPLKEFRVRRFCWI